MEPFYWTLNSNSPISNAGHKPISGHCWDSFSKEVESLLDAKNFETDLFNNMILSKNPENEYVANTDCVVTLLLTHESQHSKFDNYRNINFTIRGLSSLYIFVIQTIHLPDVIVCVFRPQELCEPFALRTLVKNLFRVRKCQQFVSKDYLQTPTEVTTLDTFNTNLINPPKQIISVLPCQRNIDNSFIEPNKPWGLCYNSLTKEYLVADRGLNKILVYMPNGEFNYSFGTPGASPGEFNRPTALVYDSIRDRFIISDKDNHRIQVFNSQWQLQFTFGSKGTQDSEFIYPWGVAVSPDGKFIAVADTYNHRIQLFDFNGTYLRQFRSSFWKNEFNYPRGIAFSPTGNVLYVTDFNLHLLFKIDIDFRTCFPIVARGLLKRPSGIVVDNVGNIIVCDHRHNSLKIFKPSGKLIGSLDRIGSTPLDLPMDVTIAKSGKLGVIDVNGRVRIF